MAKSTTKRSADQLVESVFKDSAGGEVKFTKVTTGVSLSKPIEGSYTTAAVQRIGTPSDKQVDSNRKSEDSDVGFSVMKSVRMLGDGETIHDFDASRQGKNVVNMTHFSRMNLPLITVNREGFDYGPNQLNHISAFNLYGMPKLFKSYDENKRKSIPFEDFPGRLNPVDYIAAGNYVLQYMIINDLTRNVDKFINPDTLDGVIEVFEVRESFANTSISDIRIKGIKASMPNESFYATGQGASPITNKFEIDQASNSFFEDSQDILYTGTTFGQLINVETLKGTEAKHTAKGPFSMENFIADEQRIMSPFRETKEYRMSMFKDHLRSFIGSSYSGVIDSERDIPELGTRFRSSGRGFINSPNYVIMPTGSFIDPGTDSISFSGLKRV